MLPGIVIAIGVITTIVYLDKKIIQLLSFLILIILDLLFQVLFLYLYLHI